MVLEWKFPWNWFTRTWQFSSIFYPHQIIFIYYKSRVATAIRGLWWMKMTMVNSGLKGLILLSCNVVKIIYCMRENANHANKVLVPIILLGHSIWLFWLFSLYRCIWWLEIPTFLLLLCILIPKLLFILVMVTVIIYVRHSFSKTPINSIIICGR